MCGSIIDYTEDQLFYFDDEISEHRALLQKIEYSLLQRVSYKIKEFAEVFRLSELPDTRIV